MKKLSTKILLTITILTAISSFVVYKIYGPDSVISKPKEEVDSTSAMTTAKVTETITNTIVTTKIEKETKKPKKVTTTKKVKTTDTTVTTDTEETTKSVEFESKAEEKDPYNSKYVAFSFDDGPNAKTTNRILDALEKQNYTATFFVVGYQIYGKNIDTMNRAIKMGCEIGNHTMNHQYSFKDMSATERNAEMSKCRNKIKDATGTNPVLFRPPGGNTQSTAGKIKNPIILWNIDTNDWQKKDKAGNKIAVKKLGDYIISEIENNPGAIVLMHDIYEFSAETVEYVMPKLAKKGFKVVSVSELARINDIKLKNGEIYYSLEKEIILKPGKYIVNTKNDPLSLRKNASPASKVLTTIPKGTKITISDNKNNFVKVTYDGYTGWVKGRYLKKAE